MNILTISNDQKVLDTIKIIQSNSSFTFTTKSQNLDELDVLTKVFASKPNILIFDDDSFNGRSKKMIANIAKTLKKSSIIFLTSNTSVELGKEISPFGISYYGIKPIEAKELEDTINSLNNSFYS